MKIATTLKVENVNTVAGLHETAAPVFIATLAPAQKTGDVWSRLTVMVTDPAVADAMRSGTLFVMELSAIPPQGETE